MRFKLKPSHLIAALVLLTFATQIAYLLIPHEAANSEARSNSDLSAIVGQVENNNHFLGEQACRPCHEQEFLDWQDSHHEQAMKEANEETVKANFNDVTFSSQGVTSRFYKKEGKFFVSTEGPDGKQEDYEIIYTFGTYPLQQYIVRFPNGSFQCLRTAWDCVEGKWFDLYPDLKVDKDEWIHWTNGGLRWNTACADCHSTNLQKNFDAKTNTYSTSFSAINVNCEGCHGPGKAHLDYVNSEGYKNGQRKYLEDHLYLTKGISSKEQVDQCARCHSRRTQFTNSFQFGEQFMDHYVPSILHENLYFPDGQIRDEVFVYGSFVQSKMYHSGVRCSNCHNPHSLELKVIGNALCTQCHEKKTFDTPEHHFHTINTKGAECVSCHMPGRTYMGNDYRRDHSFRVPRPDLSIKFSTPNACNECHTNKDAFWASKTVEEWYGEARKPHYSDVLTLGSKLTEVSVPELLKLLDDKTQPAIVRATTVWYLIQIASEKALEGVKKALADKEPLVRYTAANMLIDFPVEERIRFAGPLLIDEVRSVRIAAAKALADVEKTQLTATLQPAFDLAIAEYRESLKVRADFPGTQLEIGQEHERNGQIKEAKQAYLKALEMDSYFNQARLNLAHLYHQEGINQEAINLFKVIIQLEPGNGISYYSLGLLYAEEGKMEEAVRYLEQAANYQAENVRVFYNWGLALQKINKVKEAESVFLQGLGIEPNSSDIHNALCILYIQQKQFNKANLHVQTLLELYPNHPQVLQLKSIIEQSMF